MHDSFNPSDDMHTTDIAAMDRTPRTRTARALYAEQEETGDLPTCLAHSERGRYEVDEIRRLTTKTAPHERERYALLMRLAPRHTKRFIVGAQFLLEAPSGAAETPTGGEEGNVEPARVPVREAPEAPAYATLYLPTHRRNRKVLDVRHVGGSAYEIRAEGETKGSTQTYRVRGDEDLLCYTPELL